MPPDCTVIPGLHDHHVHLHSAAAALASVRVGPREVNGRNDLRDVLAAAHVGEDGWIRAVGYHEAVAGPLDRAALDEVSPDVPVRVQHRSGVLWTLNSAGLARVGLPDHPDGRLRSADPSWSGALAAAGNRASPSSVAGSPPTASPESPTPHRISGSTTSSSSPRRTADGELLQRVHCLAPGQAHPARRRPRPRRARRVDRRPPRRGWRRRRALRDRGAARRHHRGAARAGTRPGDRIEHAAVVPTDCLADLADLGVTVATQPNFVAERGDQYLADVPARRAPPAVAGGVADRRGHPGRRCRRTFRSATPTRGRAMRAAVHQDRAVGDRARRAGAHRRPHRADDVLRYSGASDAAAVGRPGRTR